MRSERGLARKRVVTPDNEALVAQRLVQFRRLQKFTTEELVFGQKTSGSPSAREEDGKLSFFPFNRTHVGLEKIGVRGRFQSWTNDVHDLFLRQGRINDRTTFGWNQCQTSESHWSQAGKFAFT